MAGYNTIMSKARNLDDLIKTSDFYTAHKAVKDTYPKPEWQWTTTTNTLRIMYYDRLFTASSRA